MIRSYEKGLLKIDFSKEEEEKLARILRRPNRVKYRNNSKLPCSFDRMLFDIQAYIGEANS